MIKYCHETPSMLNWGFYIFQIFMRIFSSHKRHIFSPEVINYLVSFTLLTFIYNFSFFPVQIAHAAETTTQRAPSGQVIKSPESPINKLEQLSEAANSKKNDVHIPSLMRDFKIIEIPSAPQVVTPKILQKSRVSAAFADEPTSRVVTMTAYNAVPEQTDGNPCIAADGLNVCTSDENVVAANFLPFGTKVMIPDYFGDKIFTVHDRTARKYGDRIDILMENRQDALNFGKRHLEVVILN